MLVLQSASLYNQLRTRAPLFSSSQVYECVLKACVGAKDGLTAFDVIRRQVAEPKKLQEALSLSSAEEAEPSGGPPDRRCWCLAAEALGRAGMVKEVRRISADRPNDMTGPLS